MDILKVPVFKFNDEPDGNGHIHPENSTISFNRTVCVVENYNKNLSKAIGTATLRMLDGTVYADIYLTDDSKYSDILYPAIGGKILKSIVDIKTSAQIVTEMEIDVVSLSVNRNVDKRIKRLGDL